MYVVSAVSTKLANQINLASRWEKTLYSGYFAENVLFTLELMIKQVGHQLRDGKISLVASIHRAAVLIAVFLIALPKELHYIIELRQVSIWLLLEKPAFIY